MHFIGPQASVTVVSGWRMNARPNAKIWKIGCLHSLQTAIRSDGKHAPAWEGLGAAYHSLGRLTAALKANNWPIAAAFFYISCMLSLRSCTEFSTLQYPSVLPAFP